MIDLTSFVRVRAACFERAVFFGTCSNGDLVLGTRSGVDGIRGVTFVSPAGEPRSTFPSVRAVAISRGGRLVAMHASTRCEVFDVQTGETLAALPVGRDEHDVAFLDDGSGIASGERAIRWDARSSPLATGPEELVLLESRVALAVVHAASRDVVARFDVRSVLARLREDGEVLAVIDDTPGLVVFDVRAAAPLVQAKASFIGSVAFDADGGVAFLRPMSGELYVASRALPPIAGAAAWDEAVIERLARAPRAKRRSRAKQSATLTKRQHAQLEAAAMAMVGYVLPEALRRCVERARVDERAFALMLLWEQGDSLKDLEEVEMELQALLGTDDPLLGGDELEALLADRENDHWN